MSDAKIVDAQSGLESAGGTLLAALSGVNMVSGAGMMAFENCQSLEKLVIDAEIIGMAKHLIQGIQIREIPLASQWIQDIGHNSNFITSDHTYPWFREEFYFPSGIIDRQPPEIWEEQGAFTVWDRAGQRVENLLEAWDAPPLDRKLAGELREITSRAAKTFEMEKLPALPDLVSSLKTQRSAVKMDLSRCWRNVQFSLIEQCIHSLNQGLSVLLRRSLLLNLTLTQVFHHPFQKRSFMLNSLSVIYKKYLSVPGALTMLAGDNPVERRKHASLRTRIYRITGNRRRRNHRDR